jgi:hypothetical protein
METITTKEVVLKSHNDKLISAISEFKKVANDTAIKIKGKDYNLVSTRLGIARRVLGSSLDLRSSIIFQDDKRVIVQCDAFINDKHVGSGLAEENRSASFINKTSALEVAESSAWGRCLACLGLSNDNLASAEEVTVAIEQQDKQLQTALQELEKVSHPGNYSAWITKHKPMFEKLKVSNPLSYQKFQERFTELKTNLETKGVLNGTRK